MIKRNIPNFFTCMNLWCGCAGIVYCFNDYLIGASLMIAIAAVMDFLDGFAARMLKVTSPIGKQLDSMADLVTFGVLPGVILYKLLFLSLSMKSIGVDHSFMQDFTWMKIFYISEYPLAFLGFMVTVFSAIRLAKFNIDTRQTNSFIGLPTPANTIFIGSLPLILNISVFDIPGTPLSAAKPQLFITSDSIIPEVLLRDIILNPIFLISLIVISSFLLVAPFRLFALKFKNLTWGDNAVRYIFLALSVAMLIIFQYPGIPFIIVLYIIISIINNMLSRHHRITKN